MFTAPHVCTEWRRKQKINSLGMVENRSGSNDTSFNLALVSSSLLEKKLAVGDPTKRRRQGRPPVNRKQQRIEKIIQKIKQSSKNGKASRGNAKNVTVSLDNMDVELPKVHTMEVDEVIMQGSVNCSTSQMVGSHGGMWSYNLDEPLTNL
ncbi:hypothetical protein RHMOL_Rhmol04G0095800 [Rhododendron molle]|uniref:Uncharacterized protein n=1 Tax=Rhododendron molle TaxID=49168 RepID=A0ACC0NZU0_RHOML|nr:hypothetical protein RHMOL_Rhmol04G0095800 [Rhododendron molle]